MNATPDPIKLTFSVELEVMGQEAPTTAEEAAAIADDMTTLFQQYLTNPEGSFQTDYGTTAEKVIAAREAGDTSDLVWGGWPGPFVTGAKVAPVVPVPVPTA